MNTPYQYAALTARQWFAVTIIAATLPASASAQTDTTPYRLDQIVVVVDRYDAPVRKSVAATSLLTRADLVASGARTLPQALQAIPGLTFVERDGSGRLPMAVARGFFGGGETSYVLLTIDGVPSNDARTGLAEWTQIPLSDVQRIEVLRGSASVAYGDAALGAVVNVVTRGARASGGSQATLTAGSWGGLGFSGSAARSVGEGVVRAALDMDREDGYRDHSASSRTNGTVSYRRDASDGGSLSGRVTYHRITNEEPGPLTPDAVGQDPRQSGDPFSLDDRTRDVVQLDGGLDRPVGEGGRLELDARVRHFDQERTRTILLAPSFGDTQRQEDRDLSAWGRAAWSVPVAGGELRVGGEASLADYRSQYRSPDGSPLTEAEGTRADVAAHAQAVREVGSRLRLDAGIRFDLVRPRLDGAPDDAPSFDQWSPRVGLNFAYSTAPSAEGNMYVTWTRAFKAPTLDQLYDAREIPTGMPGATVNLSNASLKPQRSTAVELGVYQRMPLGSPERFAEVAAAVYRQDLDDEIDFDINTFRYGNILESRHTGVEGSIRLVLSPRVELDHSATWTRATFRASEHEGNQLKNIPETAFVTSARVELPRNVGVTVTHRLTGDVWLDDENTNSLDGASLFDGALRWTAGRVDVGLSARNLLDHQYESFGYLLFDPFSEANVRMLHPAPGRSFSVTLTVRGG